MGLRRGEESMEGSLKKQTLPMYYQIAMVVTNIHNEAHPLPSYHQLHTPSLLLQQADEHYYRSILL